jgi:hypothetical protein
MVNALGVVALGLGAQIIPVGEEDVVTTTICTGDPR